MRLSDDEILKFDELINTLVEGSITEGQRQDLEEWLIRSKAARRRYIKFMDMNASLHHYAAEFQGAIPDDDPEGYTPDTHPGSVIPETFLRPLVAIAAAVALGFVALNFLPKSDKPEEETVEEFAASQPQKPLASAPVLDGVAILTQAWGLEWDDPEAAVKTGRELPKGTMEFSAGLAQLEFKSGAIVIIEGPAKLELQSKDSAYCHHGKIRAIVPEQASGFQIGAKQLDIIDLGTEFGVNVGAGGEVEVVVYEGKVEIHKDEAPPGAEPAIEVSELNAGETVFVDAKGKLVKIDMPKSQFIGAAGLAERSIEELQARYSRWVEHSQEMREDERLLLYYTFDNEQAWSRTVTDQALNKARSSNGALVGCEWVQGRWPGKGALHFKRGSDRVRIDIPGQHESMSFAAWVRLDHLNLTTTSLFLCDSENPGTPHWQFDNEGRILFSVKAPARRKGINPRAPAPKPPPTEPWVYQTDSLLQGRLGEWVHLVAVYDRQKGVVSHHVDGRKVHQDKLRSRAKLAIYKAELGNWPKPDRGHPSTNLRGCIDELAIFKSALTEEEIAQFYEVGRPNALHGWVAARKN